MATVVDTLTGGITKGQKSARNSKKNIKKMLQADPRRLLREVGAVVGIHHTTLQALLRTKLNMFPYPVQNRQQISETNKKRCAAYA